MLLASARPADSGGGALEKASVAVYHRELHAEEFCGRILSERLHEPFHNVVRQDIIVGKQKDIGLRSQFDAPLPVLHEVAGPQVAFKSSVDQVHTSGVSGTYSTYVIRGTVIAYIAGEVLAALPRQGVQRGIQKPSFVCGHYYGEVLAHRCKDSKIPVLCCMT